MTGPQSTDKPYSPPEDIAKTLQKSGVKIYPVSVGPKVKKPQVLAMARSADDVTHVPSIKELRPAAAAIAPAMTEGTRIMCIPSLGRISHNFFWILLYFRSTTLY